jgi:hypothetical protein
MSVMVAKVRSMSASDDREVSVRFSLSEGFVLIGVQVPHAAVVLRKRPLPEHCATGLTCCPPVLVENDHSRTRGLFTTHPL